MIRLVLAAFVVAYGLVVGGGTIDLFERVVEQRAQVLESY